jgi:predicted site-specific integrase-resolvase
MQELLGRRRRGAAVKIGYRRVSTQDRKRDLQTEIAEDGRMPEDLPRKVSGFNRSVLLREVLLPKVIRA